MNSKVCSTRTEREVERPSFHHSRPPQLYYQTER